jgi:hypothetical protein
MDMGLQLLFEMYGLFKDSPVDDDQRELLRDVEKFLRYKGYLD